MTTERRCEEWCGGTPGHGCSHVVRCYAGKAPCFGLCNADGWRIYGTPCRCSPECRDADARYWDKAAAGEPRVVSGTDAVAGTVESAEPCKAWCGSTRKEMDDEHVPVAYPFYGSPTRYFCTLACKQARRRIGTVPAPAETPPVKPTAVEPRQRWRDKDGPYTVLGGSVVGPAWWRVRRDDGLYDIVLSTATILASHYLGMAPAETPPKDRCRCGDYIGDDPTCPVHAMAPVPAETPPQHRPHLVDGEFQSDKYPTCPRGKVPLSTKDVTAQDLLWEYAQRRRAVDADFSADLEAALKGAGFAPAETPAPPGPVEPCYCNGGTEQRHTDGNMCPGVIAAAAPAPGVGEGARELTFAEALEAHTGPLRPAVQRLVDGLWLDWHLHSGLLPVNDVVAFSRLRWRIKPEPLPAPAPKPGRVAEMAHNLFDGLTAKWMHPDEMEQHFAAVARETFACVEHYGGDLARARAAMLGAEAGK